MVRILPRRPVRLLAFLLLQHRVDLHDLLLLQREVKDVHGGGGQGAQERQAQGVGGGGQVDDVLHHLLIPAERGVQRVPCALHEEARAHARRRGV